MAVIVAVIVIVRVAALMIMLVAAGRVRVAVRRGAVFAQIVFPFAFIGRQRRKGGVDVAAEEARRLVGGADVGEVGKDALHGLEAEFLVLHFAAFEKERELHLVAVEEEFLDVAQLGFVVVQLNAGAELDLLEFGGVGLVVLLFLALLIHEFAVVEDFANGRAFTGRNFDEVEGLGLGDAEGFAGG